MREPHFDEIVGGDADPRERERLRRAHELLVQAGPPPELPPHLEAGPTLGMTLARPRRRFTRQVALVAAALCVLAIVFMAGYISGNNGSGLAHARVLRLAGTELAPNALASLKILPADTAGNWPMTFAGNGLPKLGRNGYYEVFLVRGGDYEPCGSFVVRDAAHPVDVTLNAPYRLRPGDTWVVTRQAWGNDARGPVVLRPTM